MGTQLVWSVLSHGFLLAAGKGLYDNGQLVLAVLIAVVVPLSRVLLRFRKTGGYTVFREANRPGAAGGVVSRGESPFLFAVFLLIELAIIAVFAVAAWTYQATSL